MLFLLSRDAKGYNYAAVLKRNYSCIVLLLGQIHRKKELEELVSSVTHLFMHTSKNISKQEWNPQRDVPEV